MRLCVQTVNFAVRAFVGSAVHFCSRKMRFTVQTVNFARKTVPSGGVRLCVQTVNFAVRALVGSAAYFCSPEMRFTVQTVNFARKTAPSGLMRLCVQTVNRSSSLGTGFAARNFRSLRLLCLRNTVNMADYSPVSDRRPPSPWFGFMRPKPVDNHDPFGLGDDDYYDDDDDDGYDDPQHPSSPAEKPRWRRFGFWFRLGLLAFMVMIAWLVFTAPLSKSLQPIAPPQLTLLAADGQPIARNGAVVDRPVKAKDLPAHVKNAFLAIEDRRFYSHWGLDPRGLARAVWSNVTGGMTQGGSTITQQLAKNSFLTPERSLSRKAREMLIAFWLEAWLTKDEILERYLSNVYFGDNVYGLRAASLHYFYRQPERLTLAQASMLAGLVQAPSRLAPTQNVAGARKRAKMVLNAMVASEFISEAKAQATPFAEVDVRKQGALPTGTYFADWAMPEARELAGQTYGAKPVRTTLDANLQRLARRVAAGAPLGKAQVALVAMRPNGEVVAMIGGKSYSASPFNRATQAQRQSGSTFKLFVYLAALRAGMTPDSMIDDTPITTGDYRPKNSGERYRGRITLRQAFAQSSNVATVRLYQQLGNDAVVKAARDLGVTSPIRDDPSVALGTSGMSLLELTSAYASVAANLYPVSPGALKKEEPGLFDSLWSPQRGFGSDTHDDLLEMLGAVVNQGTGRAARLRIKAYGKTGTSQDNRDALFVGFAGGLIVGVWVGNDDNSPLRGVNGGGLPARIWADFMGGAVKGARLAPAAKPKPLPKPVDPQLPIGIDDAEINLGDDVNVTFDGKIGDTRLNFKISKDGLSIEPAETKPKASAR